MGKVKRLAMEIANELGRDSITHDQVQVEYHMFIDEVNMHTSPCCKSPLKILSYTELQCSSCDLIHDRDVIFNRP